MGKLSAGMRYRTPLAALDGAAISIRMNSSSTTERAPGGVRLLAVRLANALGKPLGIDPFPRAFPNAEAIGLGRGAAFEQIYRTNFWASPETRSGFGSEARFAAAYCARLRRCLLEIGATRLFDAPCGDLNWITELALEPGIEYLGGDISETLVAHLQRQHPNIRTRVFDICVDAFPESDAWHCRDCLFHLPFEDIRRALDNFVSSSIPYALLTTHKALIHSNPDVSAGGFRYLDLERPPMCLPKAERYLRDYRPGRDFPRYVGLWRRETIAAALNRWTPEYRTQ